MTSTQLVVIAAASAAGAGVKGVTGMGYPLLAVPLIALALGVQDAVVIVALPNLVANAALCWESRGGADETRDLGRLIGFGIIGAAVGTVALVRLPDEPLSLALAFTVLVFVVQFVRRPDLHLPAAVATRWSPVVGAVAGLFQGAIGVSGPVVALWVRGYHLPVRAYIHSITWIFGVTGLVQIIVLVAQGRLSFDRAVAVLVASIAVAMFLPLGVAVRRRLAGPAFDKAVMGVLVVSAISLVFDAVT